MIKTSVELIRFVRLTAPLVHRKFAYPLLSTVDVMSYGASRAFGFPSQPFRSHMSVQLRRFGAEVVLFPSSRVPSHRHVLHERPQVRHVRIVSDDPPTRTSSLSVLVLTLRGDPFLVIAVKNERSSANHVIFDEVMKIFILLVENRKVGLLWKVVEQVEQGQNRYADALLEHVYATLLIEGKLSMACRKGTTSLLLYQMRKSRKVVMSLSRHAS